MLRRILVRLLLVGIGIVVGLLLLEWVSRMFFPPLQAFFKPDPRIGWVHIPGASGRYVNLAREFDIQVQINSKGLRDREYLYEKPAGTCRVLALGDSFVEAVQLPLEDTFTKRLEVMLNTSQTKGCTRHEVINAGVGGYGTDNERLFYLEEGYKYNPDLVLLSFLSFNDIYDNDHTLPPSRTKTVYFTLENNELVLHHVPSADAPYYSDSLFAKLKHWLKSNSNAYRVTTSILNSNEILLRFFKTIGVVYSERQDTAAGIPIEYFVYKSETPPEFQQAWDITRALLLRLDAEVRQRGSQLVVVVWPTAFQVYPDMWQETVRSYPGMENESWDLKKPDRFLLEFLRAQQIPSLYLLPVIEAEARARDDVLYFPYDKHPTKPTHQIAAEAIHEFLVSERLLPQ